MGTRVWSVAVAGALALLPTTAGGCAQGSVPAGGVRVQGRLVDDATGKEVSRRGIWVHGFTETPSKQVSLPGASESTFSMVLPAREVRLRVADKENAYRLWERRFTATGDVLEVEVRLVPTGWVRLHGRVLQRQGGGLAPPRISSELGAMPRIHVGSARLEYREDGSYSERVPRELLQVRTVNTGQPVHPTEVDLRGVTGDEHPLDFVLGK